MSAISRTAFTTLKAGVASIAILGAGWVMVDSAPAITEAVAASTELDPTRAEQVFRYQGRVANTLLDHYPLLENFANVDPRLIAAEAVMNDACSRLTQAVLTHAAGDELSLSLKLGAMTSIDDCEAATARVEQLLHSAESI